MKLKDQVAIVTGAGTGMGRAIAERFAAEGAKVLVNYRASKDAAEEVVAGIKEKGGEAEAYQASVSVDAEARKMVADTEQRWGRLDVLVNNAGWSKLTPHHQLEDLTDEIWDRTLNTNLRGAFYATRAAVPLLRRSGGGSVIQQRVRVSLARIGKLDRLFGLESRHGQHDEIIGPRAGSRDPRQRHRAGAGPNTLRRLARFSLRGRP